MSTAGQPIIPCQRCGHSQTEVLKMSVSYTTEIDTHSKTTSHRHSSTTYFLKCPECGCQFKFEAQPE